jgi:hypothetical protein
MKLGRVLFCTIGVLAMMIASCQTTGDGGAAGDNTVKTAAGKGKDMPTLCANLDSRRSDCEDQVGCVFDNAAGKCLFRDDQIAH